MTLFKKSKTFIIAEIANAHEGSIGELKQIINECSRLKIDAIKFQIFKAHELLETSHEKFSLFQQLEFSNKQWKEIIRYTKNKKLRIFADVFGLQSVKLADKLGVTGFKIHSSEINNPSLLKFLALNDKPILLSTAGSFLYEIDEVLKIVQKKNREIILMHGFQGYPTQISDLNLKKIPELKKRYKLDVGLMDHIEGNSELALTIPLLGISLGSSVIEKHITLDRSKKGTDHYSSLNPDEFKTLINLIRKTEKSLGKSQTELLSNELKYRVQHKKNTLCKNTIKKGTILNTKSFEFKRTKTKSDSLPFFEINGKKSPNTLKKSEILTRKALGTNKIAAVIACRVESDRLFGKPRQNISDIPILRLLLNQLESSNLIDDIILAISEKEGNEIFVDFARKEKIKFVIGDDKDVIGRLILGAKYVPANIIFRVTSENPFIFWEGIDTAIKDHLTGKFDFSFVQDIPIGSGFEIINLNAFEKSHKRGTSKHRSELCSLYIHEHQNNFKINKFLPPKKLRYPDLRLTVDTPEDLLVARTIYNALGKNGKPIQLEKIINFLNDKPEIMNLNSSIPLGVTRIWK